MAKLHTRIENYIAPPSALPLPQDMLNVLGSYLNNKDLGALSQLNRQGKKDTEPQIITRAREYGYEGSDVKEARLYIKNLYSEVRQLGEWGLITDSGQILTEQNLFYSNTFNAR